MNTEQFELTIGWLYPKLMSTYGDRGNVICMQQRAQWRGYNVQVLPLDSINAVADISQSRCDRRWWRTRQTARNCDA